MVGGWVLVEARYIVIGVVSSKVGKISVPVGTAVVQGSMMVRVAVDRPPTVKSWEVQRSGSGQTGFRVTVILQ